MIFALGLDCAAYESLFLIHVIVGLGRPEAMQFKVTSEPITALWFLGSSRTCIFGVSKE